MAALYGQIRVFTKHPTSCQLFIDIVEKYKVTLFVTAPYFVPLLLSHEGVKPLESIKDFACVGASISKTLTEKVGKLFPNGQIRELYGSTEAGINTLCYPENKIGAAGKVLKNFELKIIDENGAKLGPMERGEICVRFRSDCLVMSNALYFSIVFL
jgi:acyl-coenzyme A synthetase/AMP-(fatty) acid ligase